MIQLVPEGSAKPGLFELHRGKGCGRDHHLRALLAEVSQHAILNRRITQAADPECTGREALLAQYLQQRLRQLLVTRSELGPIQHDTDSRTRLVAPIPW